MSNPIKIDKGGGLDGLLFAPSFPVPTREPPAVPGPSDKASLFIKD